MPPACAASLTPTESWGNGALGTAFVGGHPATEALGGIGRPFLFAPANVGATPKPQEWV